jgi:Domain of unknown function (DUF4838)
MKTILFVLILSLSLVLQAAIPLSKAGKPLAEIVIGENPGKVVKFAAEELQHWIKEISGAKLPIVSAPRKMKYKLFLQVKPLGFESDLARMTSTDGYAVRERGDNLYVFSSKPKGVLNGVFRLLFKNTDIIWARPNTEFGTIFSRTPDLVFTDTNYIDIPVFMLRGWQMIGPRHHMASELWQVRNGSNWSAATNTYNPKFVKFGNFLEYGGGHNIVGKYITLRKYAKKHPDFFSMKKGKRVLVRKTQLCFSNSEMTTAFFNELDAKIKENPNYDTYRIMIEDNYNLCECPECTKAIKLENGKVVDKNDKAFRSTQFFLWLNQIARHMQKHYPNKNILTFAYFFTEIPPRCKVEPNISISFCPIFKNSKATMQSAINTKTRDKLLDWLKKTKNLTLREYFGLTPPYPRPIDAIAIVDCRYVNKLGVHKTYSEMYADAVGRRMDGVKTWNVNNLYFWTMGQEVWNPRQDVKKLRREFLKRVYGKAANEISEFYSILENDWLKAGGRSRWKDTALQGWKKSIDNESKCRKLLKKAATKVSSEKGRRMLMALTKTFEEQVEHVKNAKIYAVEVKNTPEFDPEFSSGEWGEAIAADRFYVRKKRNKIYKNKTVLRILYDDKNVYLGIKCYHKNVKNMRYRKPTPGKKIFSDGEGFEIFLSKTDGASKLYSQLVVDPSNNRFWNNRHARGWKSQTAVTTDGWSAMVTVSWKSLNMDKDDNFQGTFIRHYMPQPGPGMAPSKYASLFGGGRHHAHRFIDVVLKN